MDFFQILTPIIEIFILSLILNYLLSFFWKTKSMDLVWGFLAFLLLIPISRLLHLPVLYRITVILSNAAVIAVLVIFQPEFRVALSKLSLKGKRYKEMTEFDKFLEQLASSVYKLAEKRIGALIVIENEDSLDEYAGKAIILNATFSSELLETLFAITTPLHDGAVIIRDKTILAAAVILPLAEDTAQLTKSMGTRHRAGLGLSHITDSLIIVVSEETGKVSIAREGIMTRGVKMDRFKGIVKSIFTPPAITTIPLKNKIKNWFKQ